MTELKRNETSTGYSVKFEDYMNSNLDDKMDFCQNFCYNSNLIEGIRISYIETVSVGEKPPFKPELDDHYEAFNYMLENFKTLPIIAEDLGIITDDVREAMTTYDLPGMKVLQFAFNGDQIGRAHV